MKHQEKQSADKAQWETIEALESIANQCIYKGKDVAEARALLKALYQKNIEYDNIDKCEPEKDQEKP
jgi:hypothetical protein